MPSFTIVSNIIDFATDFAVPGQELRPGEGCVRAGGRNMRKTTELIRTLHCPAAGKCHVKIFFISSGLYIIRPDDILIRPDNILIRSDELLYCSDDMLIRQDKILFRPDELVFRPDDIHELERYPTLFT